MKQKEKPVAELIEELFEIKGYLKAKTSTYDDYVITIKTTIDKLKELKK